MALTDFTRIGWVHELCLWNCTRCHSVVTDRELHDDWHADLAAHKHATLSVIGGPVPPADESVFRSGGQTHQYGPRPHISVARPDLT